MVSGGSHFSHSNSHVTPLEEDSVPVLAPQAKVDWYKALVTDLKVLDLLT